FKEQRLVVVGDKMMASFDDVGKKLTLHDQHVDFDFRGGELVPVKGTGVDLDYDQTEPLRLECMAFLDAISSRVPPLTDARSGVRVLNVLEASQHSLIMNGRAVSVAPEGNELEYQAYATA